MLEFNCALIGEHGTGKTSLAKRHLTGEFVNHYNQHKETTLKTFLVDFHTTRGIIRFSLWDTNGTTVFHSGSVQCAIVMADVSCSNTFVRVPLLQATLRLRFGNIPIALCGNKLDLGKKASVAYRLFLVDLEKFEYFDMSVKKCWNLELPFLWLSRQLMNDPQLQFVAEPARVPTDIAYCKLESIDQLPPIVDDEW